MSGVSRSPSQPPTVDLADLLLHDLDGAVREARLYLEHEPGRNLYASAAALQRRAARSGSARMALVAQHLEDLADLQGEERA